jgi:uncharacterized membrane protein YphA (DoxX/SURF4 family)
MLVSMKIAALVARILLGLIFLVFGMNGFYTFIPVPDFHPFMQIMVASGFIFFEKTIEVFAGILLLINQLVPLALLLLGPVVVNILLFHMLIDRRNWLIALVNLLLNSHMIWDNRLYFLLFKAKSLKWPKMKKTILLSWCLLQL